MNKSKCCNFPLIFNTETNQWICEKCYLPHPIKDWDYNMKELERISKRIRKLNKTYGNI